MGTRRDFLHQAAILGIGTMAFSRSSYGMGHSVAPSDRIHVGLIGCNGMGWTDLNCFLDHPEVDCVALCDVDDKPLDQRMSDFERKRGKKPAHRYKDWRKLINNKDVDVVIIGTPDHWHCLQMISACETGKDVYCEAPIGNSVEECNLMAKAAQRYNNVVQVGQWQRSDPHWQDAVNFIQSGKLGKIHTIRTFAYQDWCPSTPFIADDLIPPGVDYDMWLGPALKRPFNRNRFHYTFRRCWDYAGGLMTDWGTHLLDFALYAMAVHTPHKIATSGERYGYPDIGQTPDLMQTVYTFDDFTILWDHAAGIDNGNCNHGLSFIGENGTLILNRNGWKVLPRKTNGRECMETVPFNKQYGAGGLNLHIKNHLDCIKSRNRNTHASAETGAHAAIFSHLGNIAYRRGKELIWNGTKFTNDNEANQYLASVYRSPWALPSV